MTRNRKTWTCQARKTRRYWGGEARGWQDEIVICGLANTRLICYCGAISPRPVARAQLIKSRIGC